MKKPIYSISVAIIAFGFFLNQKGTTTNHKIIVLGEDAVSQNNNPFKTNINLGMVGAQPEERANKTRPLNLFPSDLEKLRRSLTLSNPENIKQAFKVLNAHSSQFKMSEEQNRIRAIQFLGTAVQDKDNHERERIMTQVSEALLSDNLTQVEDLRLQRSLAGDKIALIHMMMKLSPEAADSFFSKAEAPWLKKIVTFAKGRYAFFSKN